MDPIKEAIEAVELPSLPEPVAEVVTMTMQGGQIGRAIRAIDPQWMVSSDGVKLYTADQLQSAVRAALAAQQAGVQVPQGWKTLFADSLEALAKEVDAGWSPEARTQVYRLESAVRMMRMEAAAPEAPAPAVVQVPRDELLSLLQRARLYTNGVCVHAKRAPFAVFRSELDAAIAALEKQ